MQDLQSFALDISETLSNEIDNSETKIRKINAPGYGHVTAVSINLSDENLATNIYLNDYFDDYMEGKDPDEVAEDIAYRYKNELNIGQEVSFSLLNFDEVKNFIIPVMYADIPYNEAYTEGLSKEITKDLRVYYVIFDEETSKKYIINDSLIEKWGIDLEELHDLAISNIDNVLTPEIVPMTVMLAEIAGVDIEDIPEEQLQTDEMIIQSSKYSLGAVGILSEKIQDELAEFYGDNFYIIPSSTHELICTSKDKDIDELTNMLQSINETEVAPDEILGNHIFAFNTEEMKLCHGNDIKANKLMFTKQSMAKDKAIKDLKESKGKTKEESL